MRRFPISLTFLLCLSASACDPATTVSEVGSSGERAPLGKADAIGSCAGGEGEPSFCGGQSAGNCWCDDLCASYGDCCGDVAAVCDGPPPADDCVNSADCGAGEFCRFSVACGEGSTGTCETIPDACIQVFMPVCGCDDVTYGNDCQAAAAGVSVQSAGACPEPPAAASCEGSCGGQSSGSCWCDDLCSGYGDCCEDFADQCAEPVDVCEQLVADFTAQTEAIRSCDGDSDCGQVLAGTSCGCTRDWVARNDADISDWEDARQAAQDAECAIPGGISVCDCPPASGFRCNEGVCGWDYL